MSRLIKTCYVRLENKKTGDQEYYHYEDIIFNEPLRVRIEKRSKRECGLYCACRLDNEAKVIISEDGKLVFENSNAHSKQCKKYLSDFLRRISSLSVDGYRTTRGKIEVNFNWTEKARPAGYLFTIKDTDISKGKQLSFPGWIFSSNAFSFISRTGNSLILTEPNIQANNVLFTMMSHAIKNNAILEKEKLIDESFLYTEQTVGFYGLYYGKIVSIPKEDEAGSRVNLYVRVVGINNRPASFRVKTKEFIKLYDMLPDKENAWICGFIRIKELEFDNAKGAMPTLKNATPLPNRRYVDTKQKVIIREMRVFTLFCCNKAGMIVTDSAELSKSNEALAVGKKLYRPLIGIPGVNSGIMIYNENGEDEVL